MKQKRSTFQQDAMRANGKRLLLLSLLIIVPVILSGCYVTDVDPPFDDGLTGNTAQPFDVLLTATPEQTPTPTPEPTGQASNWDLWGVETPTDPPSNVNQIGDQPESTIGATQPQGTIGGPATYETLKRGSSGEAVSQLQTRLKELGYYTGTVDGQYGAGTETSVKNFQAANNLTADGVAGPQTQEAIYGYYAIRASDAVTSVTARPATTTARPATATPRPQGKTDIYLRLGDSGAEVRNVQNRLITLGYLSGSADGYYQETTEAAVAAFQKRNSLYNDGVAGPSTLSKLYSSSAVKAASVVANIGALRRGMSGSAVRSLQQALKNLGYYNGSVDGDFGAGTEQAVMAFQQANGLPADGVAGTATQNAILAAGGNPSSGSGNTGGGSSATDPMQFGPSASTNGYTTISATTTNATTVTNLQSVLQSFGYYTGSLDGRYGAGTTSAVSTYQQANGLRVTGMAGPSTQRRLYGGVAESGTYTTLRMNDSSNNANSVRNLQYTLYELMYYDGAISGIYDEATRNAVLLFQDVNGLAMDGVAGEVTQRRLYSSNAIPCNK